MRHESCLGLRRRSEDEGALPICMHNSFRYQLSRWARSCPWCLTYLSVVFFIAPRLICHSFLAFQLEIFPCFFFSFVYKTVRLISRGRE